MKQQNVIMWIGFLIAMIIFAGCQKKDKTATIEQADPQTLPTITPTSPVGTGVSPLPRHDSSPLPFPAERDESEPVSVPAQAEAVVARAKADMAERLSISEDEIEVVLFESVQWRDSSLGCPKPGMMYAQVITPGYWFVLESAGEQCEYHSARESSGAIFCQVAVSPPKILITYNKKSRYARSPRLGGDGNAPRTGLRANILSYNIK